ncbi:RNA polymerase sigma factor [Ihubacter sp. rT4E-8]|uniref:RNA polymerase sigma factor n=1 Tax=Ihubacter sp. rT4E-8 TaxID=3242369 RepID=UPI00137A0A13
MRVIGDERLFREKALCEKIGMVRDFAAICGASKEELDDIVQEVMVEAYQHLDQLKNVKDMAGWLFIITKNKVNRTYRARKRRERWEVNLENYPEDGMNEASDYQAWSAAENAVSDEMLCQMIERLKPPGSEIIKLRFGAGFKLKEIAEMLDMNYNTVKTIESRALKRLKKMIESEIARDER